MAEVDWNLLRDNARDAATRAHAPYSNYPVGAAALAADGQVVTGCNVENVSYGVGLCAECVLVGNFVSGGGGRLVALVVVDARGEPITPCGRCRQVLLEHAGAGLLVATSTGTLTLGDLLPHAFGPDDLAVVSGRSVRGPASPDVDASRTRVHPEPGEEESDAGRGVDHRPEA